MMRTYDEWKASGPHETLPNASRPKGPEETCEVCAGPVAPTSVAWCDAGGHYSFWPSRPERRGGR